MTGRGTIALVFVAALCACAQRAGAIPYDDSYLDKLRARGEFAQAEKYCLELLDDPKLTDERRVDLTIELSRTLADHASIAPADEQESLWRKAAQIAEDFAAANPRHPKLALVQMQGALAALAHGEAAREAAELGGNQPRTLQSARDLLRQAIAQLRKLDERIVADTRKSAANDRQRAGEALSANQLISLGRSARRQQARGLRNLALCYPESSPDRVNALTQAIELARPLASQNADTPLVWSSRLEEITCCRLLGKFDDAERRLAQAESAHPPADVALKLRAERIRLALANSQIDRAISEARAADAPRQSGSADLDDARLETYLAAWRRSLGRDAAEASEWEKSSLEQVRAIEKAYGTAWARKAANRLARTLGQSPQAESVEALVRSAQSLYASGQIDEALAAYDQAAKRAGRRANNSQAFDIELAAATIENQREHFRAAIDRYRKLSMTMRDQPRAAEAHLWAVYCAGQLAERQSPQKLDEYEQLLREQLATWPGDPTASQAWRRLGRLLEHQGNHRDALAALRNVKPGDDSYAAVVEAIGRCYLALLSALPRASAEKSSLAAEALAYFDQVIGPGGRPTGGWSASTRAAALAAAKIALVEMPNGAPRAEALLNAALRDVASAPAEWRSAATPLRITSIAAQGRAEEAIAAARDIRLNANDGLQWGELLAQLGRHSAKDRRRDLARLELQVLAQIATAGDELDQAARGRLARHKATALASAGRRAEAIELFESLAKENPRDGQTQEEWANALTDSDDQDDLHSALAKWREVASKCRPESPRWFRAQYGLARAQLKTGQSALARSTINQLEAAHPELGGAEMKQQFQQLLTQCEVAARQSQQKK